MSIATSDDGNLLDHLPSGCKTSFRPHAVPELKVEAAIGIPEPDEPGHHHFFFRLPAGHCIVPCQLTQAVVPRSSTQVILLAIIAVVHDKSGGRSDQNHERQRVASVRTVSASESVRLRSR